MKKKKMALLIQTSFKASVRRNIPFIILIWGQLVKGHRSIHQTMPSSTWSEMKRKFLKLIRRRKAKNK